MADEKKTYDQPRSEKLGFEYGKVVASSGKNPAQCTGTNPGNGCLDGGTVPGAGCSVGHDSPGNCSIDHERKQPFQCVG